MYSVRQKRNPKNIDLLIRYLYVTISRAQYSSQIHFYSGEVKQIKTTVGNPLDSGIISPSTDADGHTSPVIIDTSSTELTEINDILGVLTTLMSIENFEKKSLFLSSFCAYIISGKNSKSHYFSKETSKTDPVSEKSKYRKDDENSKQTVTNARQNAIRKYLKANNGIGYSKKWNDAEKAYADKVRARYETSMSSTPCEEKTTGLDMDLFKEFSEKCNKEREAEDQKDQAKVEAAMALCKYDTGELK